jgi:hypothetical protein
MKNSAERSRGLGVLGNFALSFLFLGIIIVIGNTVIIAGPRGSSKRPLLWRDIKESEIAQRGERQIVPDRYRTLTLNVDMMRAVLASAPEEFSDAARGRELIVTLPMPDGSFQRFQMEHSLTVEQGLADKFPELANTWRGHGIDDPTASGRFDFLNAGFHGMILSANGTFFIDPYSKGDITTYISYDKNDLTRTGDPMHCLLNDDISQFAKSGVNLLPDDGNFAEAAPEVTSGTQYRQYRLALGATVEYTATAGGTVAGALAAQVLIMNRVNGVYERDVAHHMNFVANNNLIVYTAEPDNYTNNDGPTMLTENQSKLDSIIGTGNYDIGHVFSTGGGGVAQLSAPCKAASKAMGVTGLPSPVGDAFAIDYVAHEMGHEWGSNHTFNGTVSNCGGGNRSNTNAYEPGSGITIMAYAGICGNQDLAQHSIDTFHVRSLEVIIAYSQTSTGNTCASTTTTGNTVPTVSVVGGTTFNVPKQTPFTLTASSSDADGDTVTYDWNEYDRAGSTTAVPNTDSDGQARAILRNYIPSTSPSRTFPSWQYILNNANVPPSTFDCGRGAGNPCLTGELLPAIARTMVFQCVARDNHAASGGVNTVNANVVVSAAAGPFVVTAPNTNVTWQANTSQTVTWNVASTTAAPISAANVDILLSQDGGVTFPTVLVSNTPNDGSQAITMPNSLVPDATTTARIMVKASGNIFFDVSDMNFSISPPSTAANAEIAGRIVNSFGNGIPRVVVSLFGPGMEAPVYVQTSPFGYYNFGDLPVGQVYVISPSSKRYTFSPESILYNHNDAVTNIDFVGNANDFRLGSKR